MKSVSKFFPDLLEGELRWNTFNIKYIIHPFPPSTKLLTIRIFNWEKSVTLSRDNLEWQDEGSAEQEGIPESIHFSFIINADFSRETLNIKSQQHFRKTISIKYNSP